jgi:flagellar hook-associated protein 1
MSLSIALNSAVSGLLVNQRSIQTASQNVANAQTEGYTRQILNRESVAIAGFNGGVAVASLVRAVNEFLVKEQRGQVTALGGVSVDQQYLKLTQDLFGRPGSDASLGARLTDLGQRIQAMSIEPESGARRTAVVDAAVALAQDLNRASNTVTTLRLEAEREIGTAIGEINVALQDVVTLNREIAQGTIANQNVSELQDQRDKALSVISNYMGIQTFERGFGEVVIYTDRGEALLDSQAVTLSYNTSSIANLDTVFDNIRIGATPITNTITSGRLRGLLDMRDGTLIDLQAQLDALTAQLRDQVNLVHNRGTALPPPPTLTGSRTFADTTIEQVTLSDPTRVAVLDAAGTITAYIDLAAGVYTIDQVRDAINLGLAGFATATAANGTGLAITATAAGSGISLVDLVPGGGDSTVIYNDGAIVTNHAGFSNFFGLNDLFVTPQPIPTMPDAGIAGSIRVRADIVADPARLVRGRLYDDTVTLPVAGTTIGLGPGDNRVALQLTAAFDTTITFAPVGSLPTLTLTLAGFANEMLGRNATLARDAENRVKLQETVINDLATRRSETSGVNVDEEMANMLAYQNAYSASARVISVVSEMMDTLLQISN